MISETLSVDCNVLRPPQTRKHCCGNLVEETCFPKCFPVCTRTKHLLRNIFCFQETKNVSDFFQKHFFSATNVSPFACQGNNGDCILWSCRLYFLKWACANACFQWKASSFTWQAMFCFPLVCAPKKHSGKQCFRKRSVYRLGRFGQMVSKFPSRSGLALTICRNPYYLPKNLYDGDG